MQGYATTLEAIPKIISAVKNPLGILALLIILIGILAFVYFFVGARLTPKVTRLILNLRLCVFLLVFSGACAFGWAIVRTLPLMSAQKLPPEYPQKEKTVTVPPRDKPAIPAPVMTARPPVAPIPASLAYQAEILRATGLAGTRNVPGNPAQACGSYAKALHLVYVLLTPSERELLRTHESACSQGRSEEHVTILQEIAHQFEARNKTPNH